MGRRRTGPCRMASLPYVPGTAGPRDGRAADPLAPLLDLPGVGEAVASARESIEPLRSHPLLRRQSAPVTTESAIRGARASAALDGVEVPLADLRASEVADPVVQGALRVCLAAGQLVETWRRAPLQALARLHLLAAAGLVPEDRLGRPTVAGSGSGDVDVSARLERLAALVAGGSRAAGPVLVAVVHGELLALRPFGSADGVVARAAARLTLVSRGVDPTMASVPEVGHLELRAEYRSALASYAGGTPDGVALWLRHCCSALVLGAQEGLAICEAVLRG
jgi:hypothetical protein